MVGVTGELGALYKLTIKSEPVKGVPVIADGVEAGATDVTIEVSPGTYKISVPESWEEKPFNHWEDDSEERERSIDVLKDMEICAYYKEVWPWYYYAAGLLFAFCFLIAITRRK